jgi:hypothetical protein
MKNIIFHNNFHRGDCFYSRSFVKDMINKIKADNYIYYTNYNSDIFKDIKVEHRTDKDLLKNLIETDIFIEGDDIYINTWVGQNHRIFLVNDCSLVSNYNMYKVIYDKLNIKLETIEYYIPEVDFNYIEKNNIDTFINIYKNNIKILVSNGNTLSGQSINFDFNLIISYLSDMFKNVIFILTDNTNKLNKNNIFYTSDIINLNSDMLEISYLSFFCNIIIGRASGPYCFSQIKDNMNDINKTYIGFSNNRKLLWYENSISKTVWSNNYDIYNILNIIANEIVLKLK